MNIKKILKHHGYKSEKDFYKDFPDEESYINKFGMTPDAYCSGGRMKKYNTGGDIQSGGYMPNLFLQETPIEDIKMSSGGIYIKPSKKGTFTAAAKKRGMEVQEFASKVMENKEDYSSAMVKKANFAKNAAKWKHKTGGKLPKEILKARLESHMTPEETNNYLMQYAPGGYMSKPQYKTAGFLQAFEGDKPLKALEMFQGFQNQNKKDKTSLGKGEDILDNIGYTTLDMALPGVGTAASIVGELGSQLAENSNSAFGKGVGNFLSTPIAPLGVAKGLSAYNEFNRSETNDRIRKDSMSNTLGYNINPYGNYQSGGNLVPLNSSDMKVVGDNPNETDGVDIGDAMLDHNEVYDTDKEFIFSDMKSLKLGNKTPAKLTTTISKISGNSDKRLVDNPQDKISLSTKKIVERMKNKIAEGQEYLATIKGYRNPDGSTKQAMKYGGYKPKYQTGRSNTLFPYKTPPSIVDFYKSQKLEELKLKGLKPNNNFIPLSFNSNTPLNSNQYNNNLSFKDLNLKPSRPTLQEFRQWDPNSPNNPSEYKDDLYKYDDPSGLLMSLAPLVAQSIQFPTKNYLQTLTNEPLGYLQQLPENINIQPALNSITDQRRAAMQNLQQVAPSVQASNIANLFAGTTRAQNEIYGNKFNTEAQLRASKLGALSQANLGMQQFRQQAMDKYVTETNQDKAQRANIRNAALSNAMLNAGKFRSEKESIDMISNMFKYAKRNPTTGEWVIDMDALKAAIDLNSKNSTTTKKSK
jgi:hypothetical protein